MAMQSVCVCACESFTRDRLICIIKLVSFLVLCNGVFSFTVVCPLLLSLLLSPSSFAPSPKTAGTVRPRSFSFRLLLLLILQVLFAHSPLSCTRTQSFPIDESIIGFILKNETMRSESEINRIIYTLMSFPCECVRPRFPLISWWAHTPPTTTTTTVAKSGGRTFKNLRRRAGAKRGRETDGARREEAWGTYRKCHVFLIRRQIGWHVPCARRNCVLCINNIYSRNLGVKDVSALAWTSASLNVSTLARKCAFNK